MKEYLVSYILKEEGRVNTDTIKLYNENIENFGPGNIGLELISELKWREKTEVVLINFWEIYDKT